MSECNRHCITVSQTQLLRSSTNFHQTPQFTKSFKRFHSLQSHREELGMSECNKHCIRCHKPITMLFRQFLSSIAFHTKKKKITKSFGRFHSLQSYSEELGMSKCNRYFIRCHKPNYYALPPIFIKHRISQKTK